MKLQGLQHLRAVAAIAVVVAHVADQLSSNLGWPEHTVPDLGARGVSLFFVLSGFIIYRAHCRDDPGRRNALLFLRKRALRILPFTVLAASLWALIALAAAQVGLADAPRLTSWVSSAFLLPFAQPEPLVIWTLRHEALFYLAFLVFFVAPRLLIPALMLWAGASAALPTASPPFTQTPGTILHATAFSGLNVLFLIGIVTAMIEARLSRFAHPNRAFAVGVLTLAAAAIWAGSAKYELWPTMVFGMASAFAILTGARSTIRLRWLAYLGDASFAIYLFHPIALPIAYAVLAPVLGGAPVLLFVMETLLLIGIGAAVYAGVERPLYRRLSQRRTPPRAVAGLRRATPQVR